MKTLYLIGGTMGVGKTTLGQYMKIHLENAVYLDGDWCWDSHPFVVNDTTKAMVMNNICFLLNSFIDSDCYENIIYLKGGGGSYQKTVEHTSTGHMYETIYLN